MTSPRPTLQELVRCYAADGIPPKRAVRYIVESRNAVRVPGKGMKAYRRAERLAEASAAVVAEIARKIARKRAQKGYDELAEYGCESRSFYRHYRTNIHGD